MELDVLPYALGFALALGFVAIAPFASTQTGDGTELYARHCATCHGDDGRANTVVGHTMRVPAFEDPKWSAKDSDALVIAAVRQSPKHEAIASAVSDEDLRAIAAHLRELLGALR
jgi:mono/diheme cytochrome c family protein